MIINLFTDLTNNEVVDITIMRLLVRCPPHDIKTYDFKHTTLRPADLSIYFDFINTVSIHKPGRHVLITANTTQSNIICYLSKLDTIFCKTQSAMEYLSEICSVSKLRFLGWTMTDKLNNGLFHPKTETSYYTFATNNNIELLIQLAEKWPLSTQQLHIYSQLGPTDNDAILDLITMPNVKFYLDRSPAESIFIQLDEEAFGYQLLEEASTGSVLITPNKELSSGQLVWNCFDNLISVLLKTSDNLDVAKLSIQSREIFLENQHKFLETFTKLFTKLFESIINQNQPLLSLPENAEKKEPQPLVSIITPTYNRSRLFKIALYMWNNLSYPNREWIIVDDGNDAEPIDLPDDDARIKHIKLNSRHTIGQKRNIAVENSSGEFIMCMDDDDFYPKNVIEHRLETLGKADCSFCSTIACYNMYEGISFINSPHTYDPPHKRVSEATLFFRREFWTNHGFGADCQVGEGDAFIEGRYDACRELDWQGIIIALIHSTNISNKKQPVQTPNGNHFINPVWGMTDAFIKLLETV